MLAVKGVCTVCKIELSIFDAGLVCYTCEKFYHGSCCKPPQDLDALEKYVIHYRTWYCHKCSSKAKADVALRSADGQIDVEKKMDLLNQIRDLIIKIEDAVGALSKRCDDLNTSAAYLTAENAELRKAITLHEKYVKDKPKNFGQWIERRKVLGVSKRERRPVRYWLPLNTTEAVNKKKDLQVFIKKQQGMSIREARKAVASAGKKGGKVNCTDDMTELLRWGSNELIVESPGTYPRVKKFKIKAPDSSIIFLFYNAISNISKSRISYVFLTLIIVIYTLLGALFYSKIEGSYEASLKDKILNERVRLNMIGNYSEVKIGYYFEFLSEIFGNHRTVLSRGDDDLTWDFIDSVYFCGVTYTTVGYGDMAPQTSAGKIFTMIYAFFGIPMFLLLLASLGKFVCKGILFDISLMTKCCLQKCFKNNKLTEKLHEVEDYDDETRAIVDQGCGVLIYFIVTLILTFLLGAVMFMYGENLTYMKSLYFVFITLSTLGFGDVVPHNRIFMFISIVYIVFGLTLVSTAINAIMLVLQEKILTGVQKLGEKVDEFELEVSHKYSV